MERDYAKEHEAALAENRAADERIRKHYDVKEAVRRANEIVTVVDETLGEVRFGILNVSEFSALNLPKCKDTEEMLRNVVYAMFHKASPEVTIADIESLPADDYIIITGIISPYYPGFLQAAKQVLKAGSTSPQKPKKLDS